MINMNQVIRIKWSFRQKQHYIDKGYTFTKIGDEFYVKLSDTPDSFRGNVTVVCDCCGTEYTIRYGRYLESMEKYGNIYCHHCSQKRTLESRREEHYRKILAFCNDKGYSLLSFKDDIDNNQSDIHYICPLHGEQVTKVTSILQGKECYKCSRITAGKKKWAHSQDERRDNLYTKIQEIFSQKDYKLLTSKEDIIGYNTRVKYECPEHGDHSMLIYNIIAGKGCPDCAREKQALDRKALFELSPYHDGGNVQSQAVLSKTNRVNGRILSRQEVIDRVEECGGILLNPDEYVNIASPNLLITCPICDDPFTTSLRHFTQHGGQACQKCYKKESVGERKIRQYLEKENIL